MTELFFSFRLTARELLSLVLRERGIREDILRSPAGKPFLRGGEVQFNLSHSGGLALVALSPASCPVGVDVERIGRPRARVAARFFNPLERSFLGDTEDFYRLWTQKESVIKYHGGSVGADLAATTVIPPNAALYRGKLSPARIHSSVIREGGEQYALSVAADCPDFFLRRR